MSPRGIIGSAAAVLADVDGCLAAGGQLLAGALDLAALAGERLAVVSNNSTLLPDGMAGGLAAQGLEIAPDRVFLAGAVTLERLAAERPGARVFLLANRTMHDRAEALGLRLDDVAAEVVVVMRDTDLTYARLQQAARLLDRGAALWAANPDLTHPGRDGHPVPESGAVLRAVQACAPQAPVTIVGKPEATLFTAALARLGASPADAVMVGDNPATDGAGAERAGIRCLLVGPDATALAPNLAVLLAAAGEGGENGPGDRVPSPNLHPTAMRT